MSLSKIVSSNIKSTRTLRGLSQAALAKKTGVSVSYISMLERGEREGTLATFEAVAKALRIEAVALFTAQPKPSKVTKVVKVKKAA